MLPAFQREQVATSMAAMRVEAEQAIAALPVGEVVDVYAWMRNLAMRIAMRALLGLDPERVTATTSDAYPLPAPRPAYSVLGHDAWADAGVEPLPDWRDAMARSAAAVAAPALSGSGS